MIFQMTRFKYFIVFLGLTGLCSCYELQSDEELREDIVGTWKKVDCKWPYVDDNEIDAGSLLLEKLQLSSNGTFNEFGLYAYCCSDDCDTSWQGSCTWVIEDGNLVIIPASSPAWQAHLNQPYPIKALKANQLVFDNLDIQGVVRTKTCYCRD